ncbi:serine/threonine-protein kinase [Amycolatopsis xylanica]|uniref:serine/threonine-protein kinase n=1 Tax=Amycolatopsis xylanica TaxID=589385 RepID=UPI003CCBF2F8
MAGTEAAAVGPYRVLGELGRGGMGRVLLASGPDGRLVAVKQMLAEALADEGFRARFGREVAASRRVSGAYTAAVVAADPEAAAPWLASVFVPGPSLREALETAGPLPEESVLRLAAGLATALAGIHEAGLVHRDLKPSNVLLTDDGPRVVDFGIARAAEGGRGELTRTGWLVGTPGFASPEQAEGGEVGPASDVFSLGSLLAAACSGASPFAGASTLNTLNNVVSGHPDLTTVPDRLRPIIAACLAKDPAARPAPARILELVGSVTPSVRPWPEAVHGMIAAQRDRVNALVAAPAAEGDAGPTVVQPTVARPAHPATWPAPPNGLASPGGHQRMAAAGVFTRRPKVNATAAAIAGSLGLATAGTQFWFAIASIEISGPLDEWSSLAWVNVLGGLIAALCLLAAAAFTFARTVAGAWSLCALCALFVAAVFVSPLARGADFGAQLDFVFGFHKANGVAAGLTVVSGFLAAISAAIAASVQSHLRHFGG